MKLADGYRAHREAYQGLIDHQPIAALLSCSDARVSPTHLFDQPAGQLFQVRVAGNTTSPAVLSSLDYAVSHLQVPLVIVLGHTHCGAIRAAADHVEGAPMPDILQPLTRVIDDNPDCSLTQISEINASNVAQELVQRYADTGTVIEAVVFDLESGRLYRPEHHEGSPDELSLPPFR